MSRTGRIFFAPIVGLAIGGTIFSAGVAMVACGIIGLVEGRDALPFLVCGAAGGALGFLLFRLNSGREKQGHVIKPVSGLLAVTLAWVFASLFGAVPLILSGAIPDPIGAFFEATSGFTTTGATVIDAGTGSNQMTILRRIPMSIVPFALVVK